MQKVLQIPKKNDKNGNLQVAYDVSTKARLGRKVQQEVTMERTLKGKKVKVKA